MKESFKSDCAYTYVAEYERMSRIELIRLTNYMYVLEEKRDKAFSLIDILNREG